MTFQLNSTENNSVEIIDKIRDFGSDVFCRLKPKPGEQTADGYVCGRGQKWPPALTLLTKKVRSKVDASLFCRSSLASGANWCSSTFGCSSTSFLLFTFFLMRNGNDLPLLSFLLLPTFITSLLFSLFQTLRLLWCDPYSHLLHQLLALRHVVRGSIKIRPLFIHFQSQWPAKCLGVNLYGLKLIWRLIDSLRWSPGRYVKGGKHRKFLVLFRPLQAAPSVGALIVNGGNGRHLFFKKIIFTFETVISVHAGSNGRRTAALVSSVEFLNFGG